MKALTEDIKNKTFKKVYLLCGEEAYLKKRYKRQLMDTVLEPGDQMNLNLYEGKGIDVNEIISQADTMPFFAERRLLVIEQSGMFKSASPQMAEYIPKIPQETCIVFVEDEVDKRGKLYKAVKKEGRVVELGRQDEKTLMNWVLSILRRERKQITSATMSLFLAKAGDDMELIGNELEKLLCYTMGREVITSEDVEQVCVNRTENKIFEMINAIAQKQQKKALDLYYDLLALKEPPMRILYLLTRQFNMLMQVKELRSQGFDQGAIAGTLGMQGFIARNYIRQSEPFTLAQLRSALKECVETEEAVKTGKIGDSLGVELLIVAYSQG